MSNENESKSIVKQQLCTITVNTVVESDEQGIEYKKRVSDAFLDNPEVVINFGLQNAPIRR